MANKNTERLPNGSLVSYTEIGFTVTPPRIICSNGLSSFSEGDSCPICGSTMEWSGTRECENCGYDK